MRAYVGTEGRKAAQAELERHRHDLEALVTERTRALADAVAAARQSEERFGSIRVRSAFPS